MSAANHALHGDPIDPKKKKAGAETSGDTRKYLYGSSEQSALEDFLFEPSYIQGGGGAMELLALGPAKGAKWLLKLFGARGINKLKPLGLGSTGRTVANNLTEQLAMKEIMSNPSVGKIIMEGLKDARWSGWSKMQYIHKGLNGNKTIIHYVGKFENGVVKYVDDFKFK